MVYGKTIRLNTRGFSDVVDITRHVSEVVTESKVKNGIVSVFVMGSTASVSTMEFEPALVRDVKEQLDRLVPSDLKSHHSQTWGDDNGFSHLRATIMGPGLTAPVAGGRVVLGTWQQIVLIDHDNRQRSREVYVQVMGE